MTELLTARIVPLGKLFEAGRFQPAAVQRDYQWDEVRAERLLREIMDAMRALSDRTFSALDRDETDAAAGDEPEQSLEPDEADPPGLPSHMREGTAGTPKAISSFYIGVLVLRPAGTGAHEIFDGLQRLTTLTILISVLRDLVEDKTIKQRLHAAIGTGIGDFRLKHAGRDSTLAAMVQKPGEAGIRRQKRSRPATESGRHIFDVARRFVVLLGMRTQEELAALSAFILERVLAGVVETSDQRLARHIFVATNLYGLPLRRDEVFKGQVLALASNASEVAEFESTWNSIRETVGQETFEDFLIAFDAIWRRLPQGADCLGDLIDHLSKNADEVAPFMRSLKTYAAAWKELEGLLRFPSGGPLGNHVWRLGFFKWKEWKPLALHWLERHIAYRGDAKHRSKSLWRFAQLNRRCMAIALYEFGEERRSEMFLKALQFALRKRPEEPFSDRKNSMLPLDFSRKVRSMIEDSLLLPLEDYEVRRSLMLWYEASLWEDNLAPGHIMGGSVEHILPDKPDLRSRWSADFANVEERYFRYSSIGNLALVDGPVNEDLGNKDFVHKKPILHEKGQFGKYKTLADVELTHDWTSDVILARARVMASRVWAGLELPSGK